MASNSKITRNSASISHAVFAPEQDTAAPLFPSPSENASSQNFESSFTTAGSLVGVHYENLEMAVSSCFYGMAMLDDSSEHFSKYHLLESNGTVNTAYYEDLRGIVADATQVDMAIDAAGNFGLAAGKLYLAFPTEESEITAMVSGFWVEENYFVTCAHFMDNFSLKERKEQRVQAMKEPDRLLRTIITSMHVSSQTHSPKKDNKKDRNVYLFELSEIYDLAIFKGQIDSGSNHVAQPLSSLSIDNIGSLEPWVESKPAIWTVAYNGDDMPLEQAPLYKDLDHTYKKLADSNPRHTVYSFVFDRYLSQKRIEMPRPDFHHTFLPCFRALAVGRIVKKTEPRNEFVFTVDHTVSGFHGCSGGMICWFERGDIQEPKVVGYFKGQCLPRPYNKAWAFSIKGAIALKTAILNDMDGTRSDDFDASLP